MSELDFDAFDADNHYYEALDAFTRHLDPQARRRAACSGPRSTAASTTWSAARVSHAVVNPTFDPIAKAGAMHDYFRGNPDGTQPARVPARARADPPPSTATATPGSACMDEQGLEAMLAVPDARRALRGAAQARPRSGRPSRSARSTAGSTRTGASHYQDRIFAAPYISLADVDWAVAELEWALDRGARVVVHAARRADRPPTGPRSPGRPDVRSVLGPGQRGRHHRRRARRRQRLHVARLRRRRLRRRRSAAAARPTIKAFNIERAALRLPRHARVRPAVRALPERAHRVGRERLRVPARPVQEAASSTAARCPGYFTEDPVETFREHVWINPFWEDDLYEIVELMGADRVIFGSDWPHIEGMPQPLDYAMRGQGARRADQRLSARQRPRTHPAHAPLGLRGGGHLSSACAAGSQSAMSGRRTA